MRELKFKIGDHIRTTSDSIPKSLAGKVGVITEIDGSEGLPYLVQMGDRRQWYGDNELDVYARAGAIPSFAEAMKEPATLADELKPTRETVTSQISDVLRASGMKWILFTFDDEGQTISAQAPSIVLLGAASELRARARRHARAADREARK